MPISESGLEPGAVVVVPFPYSDRLAEKRRPAVVVSNRSVTEAGFVWIAMITSARTTSRIEDLPIEDLEPTGLAVASVVRPIKMACIEPSRILRRIGTLNSAEASAVFTRVRSFIGRS